MSEKSKRDQIWEQKKKEREERLKKQRQGDAGKEFPPEFQNKNFNNDAQQMNGFREPKNKADQWQTNDVFEPIPNQYADQKFNQPTQIKQSQNNSFEPEFAQQNQQFMSYAPPTQGFQPQTQGFSAQQGESAPYRKNKQFIQAQVVNQPLQVQSENIQQKIVEDDYKVQQNSDQKSQKQQYGNILQQQMIEKQQQQEREKQQKEIDRQNMEEERKRVEMLKLQEQEKERKEQYRLQLQEQMKQKESQLQKQQLQQQQQFQQQQFNQQQGFIQAEQYNNQPNYQIPQSQQQLQSQVGVSLDFGEKVQNINQKQEYGQFLRNQMQNKNQNMNSQIDKKAILQQQMEVQSSKPQQDYGQKNNFGRKNINQILNQEVPIGGMSVSQNVPPSQYGVMQQQNNMIQSQQQRQQQPYMNNHQQQFVQTPQIQNDFNNNQEQNYEAQQPQIYQSQQKQDNYQIDQSVNEQNKFSNVRGNRNLLMAENADIVEVNKKQQQKTDYQKELERQIQEKKRQKEQEQEKIKREELLEEQRIQKEQEIQKKQIEEENNSKKQKQENIQKQNEQLMDQKKRNRRQNDIMEENNHFKNQNKDVFSPINHVSREFLNEEKKSEGLNQNASLMDNYRKKSSQNLKSLQSGGQTPSSAVSSTQPQMNLMQGQQYMMNQMGNNGMGQMPQQFMQQNPMMYGNQFMMGQYPMQYNPMAHMMMNPQVVQQQQLLAQQQAEILPQLYELRLQMQQQQLQMQQQIDLIKNQANVAVEERNKAEQKYQELKKQYEQKQQEERKYQMDLQEALAKNHPQNKPHQQLKSNLEFITPTSGGDNIFDGPAKYQFHDEEAKPMRSFNENNVPNMNQKPQQQNRLDSAKERGGVSSQPSINVVKYPESGNMQYKKQINSFSNLPDNNQELESNPTKFNEKQLIDQTQQEYQLRMQQYGMKSLVSDNKFIPLDILDKVKGSQITMSKLGNFGISESKLNTQNQNSAQNIGNNVNRRPQSNYRQNNDLDVKDNNNKYDIPSINSDIIKDIDSFMNKNHLADQFNTQQSFYQNIKGLKDDQKIGNENKNEINSYNPQTEFKFDHNVYSQKPPSRLGSNQQMRRTGKEQNNPFGSAARGILGDSKAFEQQKANQLKQQNTFKTNSDQEGFNLGSDFPDFSLNNKGFNAFNRQPTQQSTNQINFKNDDLHNENNNNTYNINTYNSNNFDLEKINQRNEERLKKLNQFNIPTINNDTLTDKNDNTFNRDRNTKDDDEFKKLDQLFQRFNN